MNISPTSDEKITAALVHGSVLLMFLGPIVPVLMWASQRKKSKYVSFHALQAMGYQTLIFWLWFAGVILIVLLGTCLILPLSILVMRNSHNAAFAPFLFQIFIFAVVFGLMGLFILMGLIGAVYCLLGREFRYPLFGQWLEQYLAYDTNPESRIDETHEENWVAGICHATIILRWFGIITPLVVWFTQKEHSARLRFQSMQAILYQGIGIVAAILGMTLYMLVFFGVFFSLFAAGQMNGNKEIQGVGAVIMLIFFGIIMVFWFVFFIVVPLYYLLAGFASIRVIRGHHFRYPILGKLLEKRMEKPQSLEVLS